MTVHGVDASRLLTPVVDFSHSTAVGLRQLADELARPLGVTRSEVRRAWRAAQAEQQAFERRRREEGQRILKDIEDSGKPALVIMGRPYNTLDLGANLALPQKIADLGLTVIPMDMLPYDVQNLNPAFWNMYWRYGQHILAAAEFVRDHPNLFALCFSNFSCGPDSFLLSFVEEVMGEKPSLILEMDEHGGDAGYLTRIEAFLDVVRVWPRREQAPFTVPQPEPSLKQLKERTLWVPNMHPVGAPLYAAAMRADGFRAESLPQETHESFEIGRSLTRGSECLPTACTTGSFVHVLQSRNLNPNKQALFMPGSDGPCRFGQYGLLQRLVLNRLGKGDVALLTPSCRNAYQGLSQKLRRRMWHAILSADMLLKAACKTRPYEIEKGATDALVDEQVRRIAALLEQGRDIRQAFGEAIKRIADVPTRNRGSRPLVGVVGEIYVRCNLFCNDDLLRSIETFGGEGWLAPISEWILYTAECQRWGARRRPFAVAEILDAYLKNKFLTGLEHEYHDLASPFLDDRREPPMQEVIAEGARFLPENFSGEAIITLGRAVFFARQNATLVVNVAPFACMPGTITSALCREIQAETSVPMVSLFYDGEPGMNLRLGVFLAGLAARRPSITVPRHGVPQPTLHT